MTDQYEKIKALEAYDLIESRDVAELDSKGYILTHRKTGAKIFLLGNDDENKVFYIGFRTPPKDNTGVTHILEHSVLCGSEKFPVKDPFVELVKGSLNTFLNAMTYPDKTVYPIASCNDTDFQNLMDVYMDAVFHPNIDREEKIFKQEGWHYEIDSPDGNITYNGVVYNEMKGVFSSPENVLDTCTREVMFPDTCYVYESGGKPEDIVTLSYEDYLEYYRKYYHPSNSYIYLYGDMDMAEKLKWLDEEYLGKYEYREIDSGITFQTPFEAPVESESFYSVSDSEETENATYLEINTSAGDALSAEEYIAFQVLEYVLLDAPGAPLKQGLLDAGIGDDILGGYESGILQPYFSVIAKDAERNQKDEFVATVKRILRDLAENGLDRKSVLAGINYFEFQYRESDFGSSPKGLIYGLQCMDSWLYDGSPFTHLAYADTFESLKAGADEGYFEGLIQKYFLDNPFETVIILSPEKNLTEKSDEKAAGDLARYKNSLTEGEIEDLVRATRELKEYQDEPSPKEDLLKIPMLERSDIKKEAAKIYLAEKNIGGITVLHHEMFTSGIGYLKVLFNTDRVAEEDLPYVGLLQSVLGCVNTEHYTYGDLTSEIFLNSGGVTFNITTYPDLDGGGFTGVFAANVKVLYEKIDFGFDILKEIICGSVFDDEKRIREILSEVRSKAQMRLTGAGHSAAVARATSYFSDSGWYQQLTDGIEFFRICEEWLKDYDAKKGEIIEGLKRVTKELFTLENMTVSYTADESGFDMLPDAMRKLADALPKGDGVTYPFSGPHKNLNEGFFSSSKVNYVARCGTYAGSGYKYTGAMAVLKVMLNYDYLWINLRVKGGAYGCMSGMGRSGDAYFVSYRDPNVKETDEKYLGIPEYLANFDADERDMTKYVIGTISGLDTPLTPSLKGERGVSAWYSHITDDMLQQERDEVLSVTPEDIRKLAGPVRAVLDTGAVCVIGNDEKIRADASLFTNIVPLFNGGAEDE